MNSRIAVVAALLLLLPCAAIAIPHASTPVDVDTSSKLIPAGTLIRIRMLNSLSSASTKEGTYFSWVVSDDVKVGERVVIPAGNVGWGKVVTVSPAHGGRVPGFLRLRFYSIYLTDGQRVDVAVTHESSVADQNQKNGYAPAIEDVATMFVPYFFIFDALRKGDDMIIPKNAVFHVGTLEDTFIGPTAVAINATPPPTPTSTPNPNATPTPFVEKPVDNPGKGATVPAPSNAPAAQTPAPTPTPTPTTGATAVPYITPAPLPIPTVH
jgi:hypothetical protein